MSLPSHRLRNPPAYYTGLWLCSEGRLGRVGTIKWSAVSAVVLILLMALSLGTPTLFLPMSIASFFGIGEPCAFNFYWAVLCLQVRTTAAVASSNRSAACESGAGACI